MQDRARPDLPFFQASSELSLTPHSHLVDILVRSVELVHRNLWKTIRFWKVRAPGICRSGSIFGPDNMQHEVSQWSPCGSPKFQSICLASQSPRPQNQSRLSLNLSPFRTSGINNRPFPRTFSLSFELHLPFPGPSFAWQAEEAATSKASSAAMSSKTQKRLHRTIAVHQRVESHQKMSMTPVSLDTCSHLLQYHIEGFPAS